MADQKLTSLAVVTAPLVGTDQLYLVRSGVSYQATVSQITDLTATLYQPINTGMTQPQALARSFCRC